MNESQPPSPRSPSTQRLLISQRVRSLLMTTLRTVRFTREERAMQESRSPFPTPSFPFPFGRPDDDGQPQYTLTELIGEGQSARVFRGVWRRLTRGDHTSTVVVKIFHRADSTETAERALAEAAQMDRVRSPYAVHVTGFGVWDGHYPYIVTVDHDGLDLERWVVQRFDRERDPAKLPSIEDCVRIVRDAARGVHAAHEAGVIHRDISPRNLLVCADGMTRIMDFGCASIGETLGDGVVVGTPGFMPPEQWQRGVSVRASDVAALAGILYWLVTGRMPYGESEKELDAAHAEAAEAHAVRHRALAESDVPPAIAEAILAATKPSPSERTGSAETFAAALDAWLAGKTSQATPRRDNTNEQGPRVSLRRLIAASLMIVLCLLAVFLAGRGRGPLPAADETAFFAWLGRPAEDVGAHLLGKRLFEIGILQFPLDISGPASPGEFAAAVAVADDAEAAILRDPDPLVRARFALAAASLAFEAGNEERLTWWLARATEAVDARDAASTDVGGYVLVTQLCELTRGLRWYEAVTAKNPNDKSFVVPGSETEMCLDSLRTEWTVTMRMISDSLLEQSSFIARGRETLKSVNDRLESQGFPPSTGLMKLNATTSGAPTE